MTTHKLVSRGKCLLLGSTALIASAVLADTFDIVGDGGSTLKNVGARSVLTFRTNGTFTVTGAGTVELLMVGGGGGGGEKYVYFGSACGSGGGGAGGVVHKASYALSAGTYAVTVGAGGGIGTNGFDTVLRDAGGTLLTAYGGGAGGKNGVGKDGASGGGGSFAATWDPPSPYAGGKAIYGSAENLGFAGGCTKSKWYAGGGGGAGGAGESTTNLTVNGAGGVGVMFATSGSETWYAGGGGGYSQATVGAGGLGGGGAGKVNGTDGTGGGGGGAAEGGSGIVILNWKPEGHHLVHVWRSGGCEEEKLQFRHHGGRIGLDGGDERFAADRLPRAGFA